MRTRRKTHADAEILHRGLIVQSRTLALLGRRHVRVLGLLGVLELLKLLEFLGVLEGLRLLEGLGLPGLLEGLEGLRLLEGLEGLGLLEGLGVLGLLEFLDSELHGEKARGVLVLRPLLMEAPRGHVRTHKRHHAVVVDVHPELVVG